jgi:hypothetical protein
MADILIELDDDVIQLVTIKAELNGRSFNDQILAMLTEATKGLPASPADGTNPPESHP